MKKIILACGLLGVIGTIMAGCGGNACDAYADAVVAKYEGCGVTIETGSSSAASTTCSDSQAKLAECLKPCVDSLDCKCVDPDMIAAGDCTADVAKPYTDCFNACSGG